MKIINDIDYLNKKCESISYNESKKIANKMILFMLQNKNIANDSVGLACNQLGLNDRVFIMKHKNKWIRFINPVITYKSQETIINEEGCLSIKKKQFKIERSTEITIYHEKSNGDKLMSHGSEDHFNGLDAFTIQHEIDHLNGILINNKEL